MNTTLCILQSRVQLNLMSVQDIDLPENCLNEQDIKLFVLFEFKGIGQETEISLMTSSKLFSRSRVVPSDVRRALRSSS